MAIEAKFACYRGFSDGFAKYGMRRTDTAVQGRGRVRRHVLKMAIVSSDVRA
jgi:hypothetical protein